MRSAWVVGGLALICGAVGCSCERSPWSATTHPPDPTCDSGCVEVYRATSHHFGELVLMLDPEIDDPPAQWAECAMGVLTCWWNEAREIPVCVDAATCPQTCKDAFHDAAEGALDEATLLAAFRRVFLDPGGRCSRPGGAEVSP